MCRERGMIQDENEGKLPDSGVLPNPGGCSHDDSKTVLTAEQALDLVRGALEQIAHIDEDRVLALGQTEVFFRAVIRSVELLIDVAYYTTPMDEDLKKYLDLFGEFDRLQWSERELVSKLENLYLRGRRR